MTFSPNQEGVVMSSPIPLAQSSTIHPLAHILGSCAFTSVVAPLLQFIPTPSSNGIPPFSRCKISPQSAGGRSGGTQESRKNCPVKLNHLHTHQGSPLVLSLAHCYHRHPSVTQSLLHTFHPTESALHLFPPSFPF